MYREDRERHEKPVRLTYQWQTGEIAHVPEQSRIPQMGDFVQTLEGVRARVQEVFWLVRSEIGKVILV